jgi:hypothetical protein
VVKKDNTSNMGRVNTIRVEKSHTINTIKIIKEETLKKMKKMIFQKVQPNKFKNHIFKMIIKDFGSLRIPRKE